MSKIVYVIRCANIFAGLLVCHLSFGQDYQRKIFDYDKMNVKDSGLCADIVFEEADRIYGLIEMNQSHRAAEDAKMLYEKEAKCPLLFEIYSWSMFRKGDWVPAVGLMDSAIGIYGNSNPDLILRRGYMNIEMAELGVAQRSVDGNSVFLPDSKKLPYEETNFKKQNYLAAVSDLSFLADNFADRESEIYAVGYIYQKLGEYDKSTDYLIRLMPSEEYSDKVIFMIVDNIIGQKKYPEAEESLKNLERKFPRSPAIFSKYADLYEITGDKEKEKEARLKGRFYTMVPDYCDLTYSAANFDAIDFFGSQASAKKKLKKLKEMNKLDQGIQIDMLISILNMHANHGNGVEEEAAKMLSRIGAPAVPKVIMLMEDAESTCTVTDAASILADVKDPRGWQPMVDYLPRMENMPVTLIPPNVPQQLIRFDKVKALPVLLTWIKPQLEEQENASSDPMGGLSGVFSGVSTYAPMSVYSKEEITRAAKDQGYPDQLTEELLAKIFVK